MRSSDAERRARDPHARPTWLDRERFPFASRFVELGNHLVHYIDEGRGPALLMLHGNPTWSFLYRHLVGQLRERFRCIALDYPGFGLSIAAPGYDYRPESHERVVLAFVEQLGLDAFTPVMQDWGGPIGLGVAGRVPERIEALVIGNSWAWPVDRDRHFVRFSRLMGGRIGGVAIRRGNAFVNVMIPLGTPRSRVRRDRAAMAAYRAPLDTPARREASHVFPREIVGSTPFLRRVEEHLAALRDKPALLCWGDRDPAFRARERERFEALFPRARTVLLEGAGHYIQEEAPDEIAAAVRAWWDECVATGTG